GHPLPVLDVSPDALFARAVEGRDAVGLDVGLAPEAELALDLDLDGQPVGVPAAARPYHLTALHPAIANHDVLHYPRLDVVHAGPPVGSRRPLEEDERRGAVAAGRRFPDTPAPPPPLRDPRLEGRERDLGIDGPEGHRRLIERGPGGTASGRRRPRSATRRARSAGSSGRYG